MRDAPLRQNRPGTENETEAIVRLGCAARTGGLAGSVLRYVTR